MKTLRNLLFLFGLIAVIFSASAQSAKDMTPKLIDRIYGTWKIQKIYNGNKDVTPDQSSSPQQLKFDMEGHYMSSLGGQTIDSGSYRLSESAKLLYLENKKSYNSSTQTSNQVTWAINFKDQTLTMRGQGSEPAKKLRYVYIKQN